MHHHSGSEGHFDYDSPNYHEDHDSKHTETSYSHEFIDAPAPTTPRYEEEEETAPPSTSTHPPLIHYPSGPHHPEHVTGYEPIEATPQPHSHVTDHTNITHVIDPEESSTVPVPLPPPIDRCRADDKVKCGDSNVFICTDQECDGVPDCPNGEDEDNCESETGIYVDVCRVFNLLVVAVFFFCLVLFA